MFETAKKYSETNYYRKTDLEAELDHYLIEPIWHEVTQYRAFFQQRFPLKGKQTYIVRNPLVNDMIAYTQELLFGWLYQHLECPISESNMKPGYLSESEQLQYSSLLIKMRYDKGIDPQILFQECFDQLVPAVRHEIRIYLQNPSHNLLLKLFLIMMECNRRDAYLLFYPTLYVHQAFPLSQLFTMDDFMNAADATIQELDVTSNFLSLLTVLRLKISSEMISLNMRNQTDSRQMDVQELLERYPMLPKDCILFYVGHRKIHHYYTLQDYMEDTAVCYETARYSMEKLVELKWYQKQKVGKKFVYFIM